MAGTGIDFRKSDIELYPTESQLCGGHGMSGVHINKKTECGIKGLFIAGDAASVPKQHLTGAFVFGEIAAEQAASYIASEPQTKLDEKQVIEAESLRDRRFNSNKGQIPVQEIEYKVRRMINDYVISPKSEYKLNRWLEWANIFEQEIDNDVLVRNGHELCKLYEIENIIKCGSLSAIAALERKESRWGMCHHRVDYPDTDNKNYLCHILLQKGEHIDDIKATTTPVLNMMGKGEK